MFELRTTPCAFTKSGWEKDRSDFKNCTNAYNVYHCIQDEKNRSGEICIQPVWVQPHYCPEYNTGALALDNVPCNVAIGCPTVSFFSNEVYKYPVCLNKTHRKELSDHGEYSVPWLWIAGPILVITLLALIPTACFVCRRKRTRQMDEEENYIPLVRREEDSEPFHKTEAFHEAIQYLEGGGKFLVLSGLWGSGKTKTAKEVYRSVTGKFPTIITDLEKFNCQEENQALIYDGTITRNLPVESLQEKIKTWLENVSICETKTFIIFISINDQKAVFSKIIPVTSDEGLKVINLNKRLTKVDRNQILYSHFSMVHPNKDFSQIQDLAKKCKHESLGYPEICALFCRCDEFQKMKRVEFYRTPLRSLKMYLEEIYHSKPNKFLMLVYMSLSQMEVDVKNPNDRLFNELETCKSNNSKQAEPVVGTVTEIVRRDKVEEIQSLMSWEFVDKVPQTSKYRLQHDVIKRMTLIVFGTFHFDKLLELSKQEDLKGWIKEIGTVNTIKSFSVDIVPTLFIDKEMNLRYEQKMGQKTAEDSEPFHKTEAFHEAIQYLEGGGKFLVLSGLWGSGKTKTAMELYRSVTGKSQIEIKRDLEKFNAKKQNQALVFDEAISSDLSDREMRRLQEKIKAWLENVSTGETKVFIIFTSVEDRKSTFADITLAASDADLKVINLNDRLTKNDRTQILNSHFTISCPKKDFSKIKDLATKGKHESLGYPEICALFCRCDEFQKMKVVEFCKTPLRSLKLYLEEMYHSKPNKFLMLVYMSLSQMEVDVKNPNDRLFNELETCKSNNPNQAEPLLGTITEIVRDGKVEDIHSLMSWEFVDKVPQTSKYRLQHEVIKRMTLIVFGTFHFDKLLELSKPKDLEGWIKEKSLGTKFKNVFGDIMPSLLIDGKKWLQHEQKMGLKTAEESVPFHKTEAFREAIQYIVGGGKFLVLSGLWGSGKTKTAKELYRSVTGKPPIIITDLEKFNPEKQNHALVFDEAILEDLSDGEMRRLQEKIKAWIEKVSTGETKTFIIFTSDKDRKSTFADITSAASDADLKVINLNDRLTKDDRIQILNSHFTISCLKKDLSKIEDLATKGQHESLGYPEICALLCRCENFQKMKGVEFCKTPLRSLKIYLEEMYQSKANKFLMLVYMSLSQMEVDVKNTNEMLFNELETCRSNNPKQADPLLGTVNEIVRLGKVEDIHSLMSWEFVDKVPKTSKYRLQHDVIKRMTLIIFGTFHFDKLLELSKPEDLVGWIKEKRLGTQLKTVGGDIMPSLLIDRKEWLQYEQKMGQKTAGKS
uniref:Uncharacterized protein LOC111107586 isoform X2 n=1 Tax=Crassostrea virginica TaxID=6565 RepID=A0A8B8B572_CRAVI|nr:uncharacterized protein LOC111107586 isoform X2 [Crassostrea virginica]